jgi:hypothetical protein
MWKGFIWQIMTLMFHTYLLKELGPSWGAANCAAIQKLASVLWKPKVHYRVHKSPPIVPILNQIDPVHIIPSYLSKIYFNIVHPTTSLTVGDNFMTSYVTVSFLDWRLIHLDEY